MKMPINSEPQSHCSTLGFPNIDSSALNSFATSKASFFFNCHWIRKQENMSIIEKMNLYVIFPHFPGRLSIETRSIWICSQGSVATMGCISSLLSKMGFSWQCFSFWLIQDWILSCSRINKVLCVVHPVMLCAGWHIMCQVEVTLYWSEWTVEFFFRTRLRVPVRVALCIVALFHIPKSRCEGCVHSTKLAPLQHVQQHNYHASQNKLYKLNEILDHVTNLDHAKVTD